MKKIVLSNSPISEEHVEILARIYQEIVQHNRLNDQSYPQTNQAILQANERYYLIANQEASYIGGVALRRATGEIRHLALLPQYRGQGYVPLILREVEKQARDLGLNEIHIYLPYNVEIGVAENIGYHLEASDRNSFHRLYKNLQTSDGKRVSKQITLGADPELLLVKDNGNVVSARQYFQFQNPEGYGTDGFSEIAEIRPRPSTEPREVAASIKEILRAALMTNPELWYLKWRVGGFYKNYSIGGHIHVGFDTRHLSIQKAVKSLDYFLAPFVLLLEDKVEAINRRRSFGKLSEHHITTYGIEYRVPASFIVSPMVSEQVFTLTKTIIEEVHRRDFCIPAISEEERTLFNACDKTYFRKQVPERWKVVKKMKLFEKYASVLNTFWEYVRNNKTWNSFAQDIKGPWQILAKEDWDKIVIPSRVEAERIWGGL